MRPKDRKNNWICRLIDMEELKLELNHTYLIRYGCTDTLSSVTVLMITDKAYKIRWNGSGSECWELKRRMDADYSLVEDISDFVVEPEKTFKIDYPLYYFQVTESCGLCYGSGQIPDTSSTAGKKTCTLCGGSGKTMKNIDIFQK